MVGVVGVERLARNDPLAVHDLVVGDVVDIRVAGDVVFLLVVLLQLAEHLGRGLELLGRKVLVADHQHVVGDEGTVERGVRVGVNRLAQVHAAHLGAGVFGQLGDRPGHLKVPPSRWRWLAVPRVIVAHDAGSSMTAAAAFNDGGMRCAFPPYVGCVGASSGNGSSRGGTGVDCTIEVVVWPYAKKRSSTLSSWPIAAMRSLITKQSSPVTRWHSITCGVRFARSMTFWSCPGAGRTRTKASTG